MWERDLRSHRWNIKNTVNTLTKQTCWLRAALTLEYWSKWKRHLDLDRPDQRQKYLLNLKHLDTIYIISMFSAGFSGTRCYTLSLFINMIINYHPFQRYAIVSAPLTARAMFYFYWNRELKVSSFIILFKLDENEKNKLIHFFLNNNLITIQAMWIRVVLCLVWHMFKI